MSKAKEITSWEEIMAFKNEAEHTDHIAHCLSLKIMLALAKRLGKDSAAIDDIALKTATSPRQIAAMMRGDRLVTTNWLAKAVKAYDLRIEVSFCDKSKDATDEPKKPPWDTAQDWARYLVRQKDGTWFWFEHEPHIVWAIPHPRWICNTGRMEACAPSQEWDIIIEERPKGENND